MVRNKTVMTKSQVHRNGKMDKSIDINSEFEYCHYLTNLVYKLNIEKQKTGFQINFFNAYLQDSKLKDLI